MKREIKFRAWHKSAKEMLYPENGKQSYVFCWGEEGQPVIIMQFTGLKDKQGKEIYEGDILKSESWGKNTKVKNPYHVVEWRRVGWIAIGYNGQMKVNPSLDVKSDFEVIGNIYEHSHLLNK